MNNTTIKPPRFRCTLWHPENENDAKNSTCKYCGGTWDDHAIKPS